MDEKQRKKLNWEKELKFQTECHKVKGWVFEIRWSWEIVEDVGQMVIYDKAGDMIALWEENYLQLKGLQEDWGFIDNQPMLISVTKKGIIETYDGVYALGWYDKDKMFQGIFFRPEDLLPVKEEEKRIFFDLME